MSALPDFNIMVIRERTRSVTGHGCPDYNVIVYVCGCSESWYGNGDIHPSKGDSHKRSTCYYHLDLIRKGALAQSFLDYAAEVGGELAHKVLNGDTKMAEVDDDIRRNRAFVEKTLQADFDQFYRNAWTAFCERFDEGYTLFEKQDDRQ